MPIAPRPLAALLAAFALAFGAAACGEERTVKPAESTDQAAAETTAPEPTPAPSSDAAVPAVSKNLDKKPAIPKPTGTPPSKLIIKDIVVGKGPAVKQGETATVDYVGASWSTGAEFDASWDRGQPFPFPVGGGQVIQGWDQGVAGMKVGGRRELVIPPDLGYGPQGSPPAIAPNETLVFVVDLKKIA
jgi:peptidylprolyl isomerase